MFKTKVTLKDMNSGFTKLQKAQLKKCSNFGKNFRLLIMKLLEISASFASLEYRTFL